ncbi:MAG: transposase, partial [Nitrososphaerota archaeon]|jgi:transposase|nr:transposase [Nitrososphaerota archaeon]
MLLYLLGGVEWGVFEYYVSQVLVPTLQVGDVVVVLDCLSSHKVRGVLDPIYARVRLFCFCHGILSDLNSIESVWSKLKAVLRKLKARTCDELQTALRQALSTITLSDIKNWFTYDGYKTM